MAMAKPRSSVSRSLLHPSRSLTTLRLLSPRPSPSSFRPLLPSRFTPSSRLYSTPSPLTKLCPTCSLPHPLSTSPCPTCRTLLPLPSSLTPHSLFFLSTPVAPNPSKADCVRELEALEGNGWRIDGRALRGVFLRRQMGCHPDTFAGQGEKTHALALHQSAIFNKAYSTLLDPLLRAQYLLDLHSLPISETDSLTDPELLMEIMEAREALEEAESEGAMEVVRAENSKRMEKTLQELDKAFSSKPPDIARAKELAVELQYLRNLEEAAKEWKVGGRVEIRH